MEHATFQNATPKELHRQLADLRERIRTLRFRIAGGQEKNVRDLRSARKNVARILTQLRMKSIPNPEKKS